MIETPFPASVTADDAALIDQTRRTLPGVTFDDLDNDTLAAIVREHGIDFATATLYDRARQSDAHGRFIHQLESFDPTAQPTQHGGWVIIVPSGLYREYPKFGGDGRLVRQVAQAFGLTVETLDIHSTGSVHANAAIIAERLARLDEPALLVTLCKGSADWRFVLEAGDAPLDKISAWVQVSGLIRGWPLVDALLDDKRAWWGKRFVQFYQMHTNTPFDVINEVMYGEGCLLWEPMHVPESLPTFSVMGCPLRMHLRGFLKRTHRWISVHGPNDGTIVLRDSMLGEAYPVWGADHYFGFPGVEDVIRRLFFTLAARGHLPG